MKKTLLLLVTGLSLVACQSEYEERMAEAKELKKKMERAESNRDALGLTYQEEINELKSMIYFHARVSGNEDVFIQEIFNH